MIIDNTVVFLLLNGLLGLVIGSFLSVVVHRWPANICVPRSHCLHCQHLLRWRENIPVISYLFLKGRCAHCQTKVSLHYPLLEILSALLCVVTAWQFGFSWTWLTALLFCWSLLALTFIDLKQQLLPDNITLPLLWLGLLLSIFNIFSDSTSAIIGACAGYVVLWLVAWLFHKITKKVGMGHGDFKLFAAIGAWLGWQALPFVLLIAALLGSTIGVAMIAMKKQSRDTPIPFGPFLAFAGWLVLLWGKQFYLFWLS